MARRNGPVSPHARSHVEFIIMYLFASRGIAISREKGFNSEIRIMFVKQIFVAIPSNFTVTTLLGNGWGARKVPQSICSLRLVPIRARVSVIATNLFSSYPD